MNACTLQFSESQRRVYCKVDNAEIVGIAALPQRGGCTRMSSFMHVYVCIHMSLVHIVACASQCPWFKCYNLGLCIVLLHNSKQYVRAIVLCASRCYSPLSRKTQRISRGVFQWSYLETIYRLSACITLQCQIQHKT